MGNQSVKLEYELHPLMHQEALLRLHNLLARHEPYDPVRNNCEIFARKALLEEPKSPQVAFWVAAVFVAALCYSAGH